MRQGNSGPSGARPRPVWAWMPLRRHDHRICTARRPATTRVRFSNASQKQRALSTPGRVPHIVGVLRAWVHLQHSGERKPNHPQRRRDQYALARGPAYAAMPSGSLSAMGAGIPSSPSHQCTTSSFEQRWLYSDPTILLFSMGPNLPHAAKLPLRPSRLPCPSPLLLSAFSSLFTSLLPGRLLPAQHVSQAEGRLLGRRCSKDRVRAPAHRSGGGKRDRDRPSLSGAYWCDRHTPETGCAQQPV